jgi:hypothetical protein
MENIDLMSQFQQSEETSLSTAKRPHLKVDIYSLIIIKIVRQKT